MSALFSVLFSFSAICFVRLQDIPKNTVFLSTNIVGKPNRGDCKATWELKNSNSAMRHDSTVYCGTDNREVMTKYSYLHDSAVLS